MVYIEIDETNKVVYINYKGKDLGKGYMIDSIPDPEPQEGKIPVMYYEDGSITYRYEDAPEVPEEETPQIDKTEMIRSATEEKVKAMFFASAVPSVINTFGLTNNEALSVKEMFPQWKKDVGDIAEGDKYQCDGDLWECIKAHTSQENWKPSVYTSSLWKIVEEEHEGTLEDPIPYKQNMAFEKGKYYEQYGIVYLCVLTTQTGYPNDLKDLPTIVQPIKQ